jgi:hypothetical protein
MSIAMEQAADAILQAAEHISSQDELSELDDADGDGSSSLSDIEDKDPEQDEDIDGSDDLSSPSDDENDSEAETERLEESPNKIRTHKDVVLNSRNDTQTYERSPSKLHNQITVDDPEDEEDDDPLTDDDLSPNGSTDSPKSSVHDDADHEVATVPTSLEDSSIEGRKLLSVADADSRKRKRSIMAGSGLDTELDEPSRKRTGSVLTPGDEYAIDDDANPEEEVEPDTNSGNISGDEGEEVNEEAQEEVVETTFPEDEPQEPVEVPPSPKRRGRKKKKVVGNGVLNHVDQDGGADDAVKLNGHGEGKNGEEETADGEGDDEAEVAQRNEEERGYIHIQLRQSILTKSVVEKKRIALEQLSAIERQFATFRDRSVSSVGRDHIANRK